MRKKALREGEKRYQYLVDAIYGEGEPVAGTHAGPEILGILDALPFYVMLVDADHNILLANKAVCSALGVKPEKIIGGFCPKVVHGLNGPYPGCPLEESVGKGGCAVEREFYDPNTGRWVNSAVYPLEQQTRKGRTIFFHIVRDITERKKAEETLDNSVRQQAAVAHLGQRALAATGLDTLMNDAVAIVAQGLDVEYAKILELLPQGNELLLRAGVGWKGGIVGHATVDAGIQSQAGYTLVSSGPVIVKDLRKETRFSGPPLLTKHGVISGISVIIPGHDRPFGVLGAHATRIREFTKDDRHFMQAVANVIATAIERRQAESALRESEEKFRDLSEQSPNMIFINKKGGIVYANKKCEETMGYKREEFYSPGFDFLSLIAPEFREAVKTNLGEHMKGKDIPPTEYTIITKKGKMIPTIHTTKLIRYEGEAAILGIITDVTERKKVEEILKESEERYRRLVELSPDAIVVHSKGELVYVNPAGAKLMGAAAPDDIIGKKIMDFVHPDYREIVKERVRQTQKEGKTGALMEEKFIRLDGQVIDVEVVAIPLTYRGKPATQVVIHDVTEHKRADELLKRSIEELAVVHEIDRSIIEKPDLSSLLRFIVRKARELTGADTAFYSFVEDDVIRHHTFSGIRTKTFKDIKLKTGAGLGWLVVKEKKPVIVEDFVSDERLKGAPYDAVEKEGLVSFLAVPFTSGGGKPIGVLYVANREKGRFVEEQVRVLVTLAGQSSVVVEHARLYEKTKRAYEELKSLDELKSNLIANVSHELRTPITIAESALEFAMDETDVKKRNELLEMAKDALVRQNSIVGNLIEAAYMETSRREFKFEDVDLAYTISAVCGEFKFMVIQRKIKVDIHIKKDTLAVRANHKQVRRVLRNLISNAIKFNKKGGEILIEAKQKGKFAKITIADTGVGIAKEHMPKVFDRFYQADASSSRTYGGTGLGLAVVKEIIEAHGGTINVESEPGEGTKFSFTLPLAKGG